MLHGMTTHTRKRVKSGMMVMPLIPAPRQRQIDLSSGYLEPQSETVFQKEKACPSPRAFE